MKLLFPLLALAGVLPVVTAWADAPAGGLQMVAIPEYREVPASIEGTDSADVRARVSGTVEKVLVARGDTVKKGQVMGIVQDSRTSRQVDVLAAQVQALDNAMKLAAVNADRFHRLAAQDAVSKAQVDQADSQLAGAKASWAAAESQYRATKEAVVQGKLLAPLDGEVSIMNLVTGTVAMPGDVLVHVATRPLRVKLQVPEGQADTVKVGDAVALSGLGDMTGGVVETVYPSVEGGAVTVMVKADGLQGKFIGQKLTAMLPVGSHMGLMVRAGELVHRNGLTFAKVKGVGMVVVQTGVPMPGGQVEVLSGLKAGDVLEAPAAGAE